MNLQLIFTIAVITIVFMYFQVNKLTKNLDENLKEENTRLFLSLLDFFLQELNKNSVRNLNFKNDDLKDEYFNRVSDIKSQAQLIKSNIQNNKISQYIQTEIVQIFKSYEKVNDKFLQDSDDLNNSLKEKLAIEFNKNNY